MFSQETLKNLFTYDTQKGQLIKINGKKRKAKSTLKATYSNVMIEGKAFREHRAIWIWHYGDIPNGKTIDHKDGNSKNNRIENLRLCTYSENNSNKKMQRNNKTGYKGVHRSGDKYAAGICQNRKIVYLGRYDTATEAAMAYDAAAIERFGEFAKTNASMGLL